MLFIIVVVIIILMHTNSRFNMWVWKDHGSVADWVSSLATAGAFLWGVYAINKQTDIQRALNIENQRLRFSFERSDNIREGDIVLRSNSLEESTSKGIQKRLNKTKRFLFRLKNISNNQIYSVKIILKHDQQIDRYVYHGLSKGGSVILIPSKFIKKYEEIMIKFGCSANEVGYMQNKINEQTEYYFVKGDNRAFSKYSNDYLFNLKQASQFDQPFKEAGFRQINSVAHEDIE